MFGLWFFGMIVFWVYRIFWAGFKSKELFYSPPNRYDDPKVPQFDEGKLINYTFTSFIAGLTWMVSVPAYGIYKLGQHFNKGE